MFIGGACQPPGLPFVRRHNAHAERGRFAHGLVAQRIRYGYAPIIAVQALQFFALIWDHGKTVARNRAAVPQVGRRQTLRIGSNLNAITRLCGAGFKIGPKDGSYFISLTDDAFTALIGEYLRPATKSLLFG